MNDMPHWNEFVRSVLSGKDTPDKDCKGKDGEKQVSLVPSNNKK